MGRRASQKLNPQAVKAANAAVGNRKLHPTDPADAADRQKWMDAYEAAGGEVQDTAAGNDSVSSPVQSCPKPVIDLQYLRADGQGVKGAKYEVFSVDLQGNPDGVYEKTGTLDGNGSEHLTGLPEVSQIRYHFEDDPQPYEVKPEHQPQKKPDEQATRSILGTIGDWVSDAGAWVWGTAQGDFNKDQTAGQLAVNTFIGLFPIADQVLDVRDIIAGLKDIIEFYTLSEEDQKKKKGILGLEYETWLWINVFLIAIGVIPTFGSAIKGVLKGVLHYLERAGKTAGKLSPAQLRAAWELIVSILNKAGIGNAHKWLKEFPGKFDGWMNDAAEKIKKALDALNDMMDSATKYSKILGSDTAKKVAEAVKKYKAAISTARKRLDAKKAEVSKWFKDQIEKITQGSHKFEARGATGTNGNPVPNKRVQTEAEAPDPNIPQGPNLAEMSRFEDLARQATKNSDSSEVILGKYSRDGGSYDQIARDRDATYFNLDNWDEVQAELGREKMWNINREFLDQQHKAGKEFVFSHDPSKADGYFAQEIDHLKNLGVGTKGFEKSADGLWRPIP